MADSKLIEAISEKIFLPESGKLSIYKSSLSSIKNTFSEIKINSLLKKYKIQVVENENKYYEKIIKDCISRARETTNSIVFDEDSDYNNEFFHKFLNEIYNLYKNRYKWEYLDSRNDEELEIQKDHIVNDLQRTDYSLESQTHDDVLLFSDLYALVKSENLTEAQEYVK